MHLKMGLRVFTFFISAEYLEAYIACFEFCISINHFKLLFML